MNEAMLLVLDEGTTSTRAMLYTPDGVRVGMAQRDLTQYYPRPGWVEQDATEIWERTLACAQEMVAQAGGADRIIAIGITNRVAFLPCSRVSAELCTPLKARVLEGIIRFARLTSARFEELLRVYAWRRRTEVMELASCSMRADDLAVLGGEREHVPARPAAGDEGAAGR